VELATNPLYALTLVRDFSPDVVFLDIGLPHTDGYEVLARLKRTFARARIYAITGRSDEHARRRSTEAGFDGYFVKPVDFAEIEKLLEA
jgi:DNA-binding response OmpR family regulator